MRCVPFPEANKLLKAAHGTEDRVMDVYAYVDLGRTLTCWEPDERERAMIAAGGKVWLHVMNEGMHPCCVDAYPAFVAVQPDERRTEEISGGAECCRDCQFYDPASDQCRQWAHGTVWHHWCKKWETAAGEKP